MHNFKKQMVKQFFLDNSAEKRFALSYLGLDIFIKREKEKAEK